jgi:hypothetical protein
MSNIIFLRKKNNYFLKVEKIIETQTCIIKYFLYLSRINNNLFLEKKKNNIIKYVFIRKEEK